MLKISNNNINNTINTNNTNNIFSVCNSYHQNIKNYS